MSSEDSSSSYPDESELELSLGLSLAGAGKATSKGEDSWNQHARSLSAQDFSSIVSAKCSSSSSSSSSSALTKANNNSNNGCCGTKRAAEPSSPPGRSSQVVGWPPIRINRMNKMVNHAKSPATQDFASAIDKSKSTNAADKTDGRGCDKNKNAANEQGLVKKSFLIKVYMDGILIGRKVDLNAHSCYETLARAMNDMFRLSAGLGERGEEQVTRLLDGSSEYVLTYEDKDGDWMLVGDVPWEMFLSSVRRLRVRRATEANGLG